MVAKFVIVLSLAVAASAVPLVPIAKVAYAEPEAPAHYEFQYSVHDEQTGDIKQQQEARAGDDVHGSYSLVQPDGVHRIVEYTASKEQGFNAVVRYEGHPIAAPAPAKVAFAAPVAKLAYATAPVAKVAYASPVSYHAAPVSYHAAPVSYHATPVSYHAAPVTRVAYSSPISYASPVAKVAYAAPVQKYATYASPLTQVSFSSPAISYHH